MFHIRICNVPNSSGIKTIGNSILHQNIDHFLFFNTSRIIDRRKLCQNIGCCKLILSFIFVIISFFIIFRVSLFFCCGWTNDILVLTEIPSIILQAT